MTPVQFTFVTPDGLPIQHTTVEIQLSSSGFDDTITGVIMPRPVLAQTDGLGKVTVELAPSPVLYYVTVLDPISEAALSYKFIVPELEVPGTEVRLQDIVVEGAPDPTGWDDAALLSIHDAKANAIAASLAAGVARDQAEFAANNIGDFASQAAASATASETARVASVAAKTAAEAAKTAAQGSESLVLSYVIAAAGSQTAAATSASLAANSQVTATNQAAAALASKNGADAALLSTIALVPSYGISPPSNPVQDAQWIDSNTGRRYSYLFDGTSSQWVETGAVVQVGYETALQAAASAVAAQASAVASAASATLSGISGVIVDGAFNLVVTRADGTVFTAGYVRGPQGAPFTVNAIGANLAARSAYDTQAVNYSFLDAGAGNLYFRIGASGGWTTAIPFGKGEKGDTGTTDYNALTNRPSLGTAAALSAPATGVNATTVQVVKGDDTRLTDARTPVTHTHTVAQLSNATGTGTSLMTAANAAAARAVLSVDQVNNTSDVAKPISSATQTALDQKATVAEFTAHSTNQGNPHGVTKAQLGMSNVENTLDSQKSVNYANGAGYATGAGNVNGISGWNYSNRNYNPAYLWATQGSGADQFLVTPGNLSVNYANSANYSNSSGQASNVNGRAVTYRNGGNDTHMRWDGGSIIFGVDGNEFGGTLPTNVRYANDSNNANRFQGRDGAYWLNNGDSAVRNLRNFGAAQCLAHIAGYGDVWWPVNPSDERLKENIVPTQVDSLGKIKQIDWFGFNYKRLDGEVQIDDGQFNKLGPLAQQLQKIDPEWVGDKGTYLQPHVYNLLMAALHSISQLEALVADLKANK